MTAHPAPDPVPRAQAGASSPVPVETPARSLSTRTRIKICGLTREQDVDAAVAAGVDAIGFVMYDKSPRYVTPQRAAELARRLPPFVTPVLLFVNEDASKIVAISDHLAMGPCFNFTVMKVPHSALQPPQACAPTMAARRTDSPCMRCGRFDLVKFAADYSKPRPSCSTPMSTVTAAAAKHSIGHSFHQASTLTSFCLVDSRLQT
jgi:phosphoribosylanthranilate isomerase